MRAAKPSQLRRRARQVPDTPMHLVIRSMYVAAGAAALVSTYTKLLDILGDPLMTAMVTLSLAALLASIATGRGRRP